jgi:leucyl/phenylalanyl-tRNA---protein transferase
MPHASITPEQLLSAYARGYFPMAEGRDADGLNWYYPERRGILPLDTFHVPGSLRKFLRKCPYDVKVDTAFEAVIRACADVRGKQRTGTWINDTIIALYSDLARRGFAHSVECWLDDRLAGGLYGVSLGGAFFGESMFSFAENASKVALVHLVERLKAAGYLLLDTQYVNDHLKQFGVREVARADYLALLENALNASPNPSTRFLTASDIRS